MLVCDHKMMIRFISAKYPGSAHDSMVFNQSILKTHLQSRYESGERNTWMLGDAGYSLQPFLMTPYRTPEEGSPEALFTEKHSKARNIIERTIGVLKSRFRWLLGARALHYALQKAKKNINVCAALHNICRLHNLELQIEDNESAETNSNSAQEIQNVVSEPRNDAAEATRREISRFLYEKQ